MGDDRALLFDRIADAYDDVRPAYPAELVEAACSDLGLEEGSRVLEVGCGTGKLTRDLVARGLRVEAVDPGPRLVEVARGHVGDAVRFHLGRFEDVQLPESAYDAVFSATAFHWVDPDVGWAKARRLLRPGGGLALLTYAIESPPELLAAWREVLPEAATWVSRDPETLWAGAEERRGDVSELWSWIVKHDLARAEAAALFGDARINTVPIEVEETRDELLAAYATSSHYLALDAERRQRLDERIGAFVDARGGVYRATSFAVLVTARAA